MRYVDNLVDSIPPHIQEFYQFRDEYWAHSNGCSASNNSIIISFLELACRRRFPKKWIEAFFRSMEMDLTISNYNTIEQTIEYIYGSAEVIGLFMANIMGIPDSAYHAAKLLGRSMQYINFIRDIDEDNRLGRRYLPIEGSGLNNLSRKECSNKPDLFRNFVNLQLDLYNKWRNEGVAGYQYIPRQALVAIKTADDMYRWTALSIKRDPFIVFRVKVKPTRMRVFKQALINQLTVRKRKYV